MDTNKFNEIKILTIPISKFQLAKLIKIAKAKKKDTTVLLQFTIDEMIRWYLIFEPEIFLENSTAEPDLPQRKTTPIDDPENHTLHNWI